MKIYYVVPNFEIIGAQRIVVDLGNKLLKKGFDVYWISGGSGNLFKEIDNSKYISFAPKLNFLPKFRVIESLIRLLIIINKVDKDVVISVSPFLNRYLCFLKKIKVLKSYLVLEDHAIPQVSNKDEFPSKITRYLYESTVWIYNKCDKLRVLSPECKEYYDRVLTDKNKVVVYPNLINLKRILNLAKKDNSFPKKNKKRIVYIGRFTTQKNLGYIIKIYSKIVKNLDIELFIIGSGPLEKYLKSLVLDLGLQNVFFLKSSIENYSILKTADLFPIASVWEGMPITMCEAMLLEVPVISTDFLAGPKFYLDDGSQRGWIVSQNDIISFINTIKYVLSNPAEANRRKSKAKSFILKRMDIDKNIDEYQKIFLNFK